MRRFLYYFSGLPGMNPRMLADRGLLPRFKRFGGELIEHGVTAVDVGPDGKSGCIVAAGAAGGRAGVRWTQGEHCWVGIEDPDLMPRPCDLEREMGIAGPEVTLGDGNAWRVPLVRRWDAQRLEHVTMLPQAMRTVMEGGGAGGKRRVVIEVTPEYASVDASADRIFAGFTEGVTVPLEEVFAQAVELLAVNYRIGQEEAGLLGLLDEARALEILGMCIDLPAMNAHAAELMMQGLQPGSDPVIEEEL